MRIIIIVFAVLALATTASGILLRVKDILWPSICSMVLIVSFMIFALVFNCCAKTEVISEESVSEASKELLSYQEYGNKYYLRQNGDSAFYFITAESFKIQRAEIENSSVHYDSGNAYVIVTEKKRTLEKRLIIRERMTDYLTEYEFHIPSRDTISFSWEM